MWRKMELSQVRVGTFSRNVLSDFTVIQSECAIKFKSLSGIPSSPVFVTLLTALSSSQEPLRPQLAMEKWCLYRGREKLFVWFLCVLEYRTLQRWWIYCRIQFTNRQSHWRKGLLGQQRDSHFITSLLDLSCCYFCPHLRSWKWKVILYVYDH